MSETATYQALEASANLIYLMILEGKIAHAVSLLFILKETNFENWLLLREEILCRAHDQKSLQNIAMIIDAASRRTLSESTHFIPGLLVFAMHEDSLNRLKTELSAVA